MPIAGREFVQALTLPLRQAMAAVVWLEGRVANTPKADESTAAKAALSDGDCVSQEILVTALAEYYPGVVLDAEEDTPSAKAFEANDSPYTVRIDPIDGSLRYLQQDGLYAIIIGLEREGRVEAALVSVPQEDVIVRAVRGGGADISYAGRPFSAAGTVAGGSRLLVSYGLPEPADERLRAVGHHLVIAAGGAIGVAPLLTGTHGAVRLTPEAKGLSPRAWVASLPVLEAGGVVEGVGAPLPDRYEHGVPGMIVAANSADAEALRRCIS